FLAKLPLTAPRQLARQARLERDVTAFEAEIGRAHRGLADMDLSLLPDDGLATTLKGATVLLDRTGTLMLACASASLASHLGLCFVLEKVAPRSAAGPLAQALVGGVRELESAGPGIALARVADAVRADPLAHDRMLTGAVHGPKDLPEGGARRALE